MYECMYDGLCVLVSMYVCEWPVYVRVDVTPTVLQSRAIPTLQWLVSCLMNMTSHSIYVYVYLSMWMCYIVLWQSVNSVTALANGSVVSASCDSTLKVWNPVTGQCLQTLTGHTGVSSELDCVRMHVWWSVYASEYVCEWPVCVSELMWRRPHCSLDRSPHCSH
jgi:hypothetical protein